MSRTIRNVAWALAAGVLASQALAQAQKMQPGLWEHSFTMKTQGGQMENAMAQMQQQLANMPPEQRKMVEQMMAKQGLGMGNKANSVKVCISKEQAELDRMPQQEGCTQKVERLNASTVKVAFECKGNPPSSGEGTLTFSKPTAYTGQFKVKTVVNNQPEQIDMAQSGQWLAADCGNLKPR